MNLQNSHIYFFVKKINIYLKTSQNTNEILIEQFIKVLFFNNKMDEHNVYEKSMEITCSGNPLKQAVMSCIIYSAQYYPNVHEWIEKIVIKCCQSPKELAALIQSFQTLIQDLNRQVIYGPSADFVSVSDRPHKEYLNSGLIRQEATISKDQNQLFINQIKNSSLNQFVSEQEIIQLLWYKRSNYLKLTKFINKQISTSILKQLQINGQSWSKCTSLPTVLITLERLLTKIISTQNQNTHDKIYLILGRLYFLHNKILQNPAKLLAEECLKNYRKYIRITNEKKNLDLVSYIQLLLQYAHVLVFYYKYGECERIIEFTKSIANLQIQFTGKMGRRTKYQTFDTPQLVMNLKQKGEQTSQAKSQQEDPQNDKDAIEIPDAKQLVLKQIQTLTSNNIQIQQSKFDDENILLEKPKLIEEQTQSTKLSIQKIIVALSSIQYMWDSTPRDQFLYQHISTSIQTIMSYKQTFSYPLMFNILLLRSLNQFPRSKNVQRALDQLEKLKNNYNQKTSKDTRFLYSSAYLPFSEFIKILAQKYMEIGMTMTAIQLYEKVGMLEECIDGLIAKNFKQKAENLAIKYQKQYGKTPRLLCMLGDLQDGDKCVKYYTEAWELSGNRNARSQRALGWHYFRKKQYEKASQAFKKATQANFYHPNTWFTLGCCYMQLKEFQKAIPAFGECVCIDDTQGEAWGNIATCYIYQNRFKQAYSTLQQALKHSEKNWKLWANMLTVSLKVKKFYKFFECVERLVSQQKSQLVNAETLRKLVSIFQYQQDNSDRRRTIQAMKNRLDRLYSFLIQKIGQNPIVWGSIHQYNKELENFVTKNYKHYKKLHEQNKIDKNDLLDGYETVEQMNEIVNESLRAVRQNIVSSKQTELNMTMKIGWQSNKKTSEEVVNVLQQYINVFEKYQTKKDEKTLNQYKLFVNGVRKNIQKCLDKPIELKSNIL